MKNQHSLEKPSNHILQEISFSSSFQKEMKTAGKEVKNTVETGNPSNCLSTKNAGSLMICFWGESNWETGTSPATRGPTHSHDGLKMDSHSSTWNSKPKNWSCQFSLRDRSNSDMEVSRLIKMIHSWVTQTTKKKKLIVIRNLLSFKGTSCWGVNS